MAYSLTDRKVQRVLKCFRFYGSQSLAEVVTEYNRIYPPSLVRRVIGMKTTGKNILPILRYIVAEGILEVHTLSFTDQTVAEGCEKHYSFTQKGIRFLGSKKKS